MKIKAVIFDVDGVLVDSVPYHFRAWRRLFREQNVKFSYNDYLRKVNGLPRITGIKNILSTLDKKELNKLAELKQSYFLNSLAEKPPKPLSGTIDLLKKLRQCNFLLAAASSSKNVKAILELTGLYSMFSAVITGHDFTKSKPDPEIFLLASMRLGIVPVQCVVVEDALLGVQAAKNAGMKTIGLLSSHDKLIQEEADLTLKSLKNYRKIISFLQKQ